MKYHNYEQSVLATFCESSEQCPSSKLLIYYKTILNKDLNFLLHCWNFFLSLRLLVSISVYYLTLFPSSLSDFVHCFLLSLLFFVVSLFISFHSASHSLLSITIIFFLCSHSLFSSLFGVSALSLSFFTYVRQILQVFPRSLLILLSFIIDFHFFYILYVCQ